MLPLKKYLTLLLLVTTALQASGQRPEAASKRDSIHRHGLVLYLGGGAGYFLSNQGAPSYLHPSVNRINAVGTVRIMWHPRFLLRCGLESGQVDFYSYRLKDSANNSGNIRLSAIPVLLVWSMAVARHFNIFAGSGGYIMTTSVDYQGQSKARKFNVGWMAAASYILPVFRNSGLGLETKWLYAAGTSDGSLCIQLQYVWNFLK